MVPSGGVRGPNVGTSTRRLPYARHDCSRGRRLPVPPVVCSTEVSNDHEASPARKPFCELAARAGHRRTDDAGKPHELTHAEPNRAVVASLRAFGGARAGGVLPCTAPFHKPDEVWLPPSQVLRLPDAPPAAGYAARRTWAGWSIFRGIVVDQQLDMPTTRNNDHNLTLRVQGVLEYTHNGHMAICFSPCHARHCVLVTVQCRSGHPKARLRSWKDSKVPRRRPSESDSFAYQRAVLSLRSTQMKRRNGTEYATVVHCNGHVCPYGSCSSAVSCALRENNNVIVVQLSPLTSPNKYRMMFQQKAKCATKVYCLRLLS